MSYYKLIHDNNVVEVTDSIMYVKKQSNGIMKKCSIFEATGVLSHTSDVVYSVTMPCCHDLYVNVVQIDEQEYLNYIVDTTENSTQEEPVETPSILPLTICKIQKIQDMSRCCKLAINKGFDITLFNTKYHFSLTEEDQLNLLAIQTKLISSEVDKITYHADGMDCEFFDSVTMKKIIEKADVWKNYNLAYFNSLRKYINSLLSQKQVSEIYYGINMPDEFKTDVLKHYEILMTV